MSNFRLVYSFLRMILMLGFYATLMCNGEDMHNESQPDISFLEESPEKKHERKIIDALESMANEYLLSDAYRDKAQAAVAIQSEIINLNEKCPHYNKTVLVSGNIDRGFCDENDNSCEENINVEDKPMRSRGFAVRYINNENNRHFVVGHQFEELGTESEEIEGMIRREEHYLAFAPYDTVNIEHVLSPEQRHDYIENHIPEITQELEQTILNSPDQISALLNLRTMDIDDTNIPSDYLRELVAYASDTLDVKEIPLTRFDLKGSRIIQTLLDIDVTVPFDKDSFNGGSMSVLAKPKSLYIGEYASYVDGEFYLAENKRWIVELAVESADKNNQAFVGKTISIAIPDIVDAYTVTIED